MTDQGKVHAVWGVIVIVLLAIIGYLVFMSGNRLKDENVSQNQNTLMENEQKPATVETTESTAVEEASAWKLYQNSKLGFEIKYPSDGEIDDSSSKNGVRIQNLDSNIPDNYQMQAGDYYIELGVQTGTVDCKSMFANYKVVTVEGVSGYRGEPNPGPGEGYKDLLCFNKAGKNYIASTTFGVKDETRVTIILDSFKLFSDTETSWKTYTNTRFGFSLNFPERWKGYKVTETKDDIGYHYAFKIAHSDGSFRSPFTIDVVTTAQWKILQEGNNPRILIKEKGGNVFSVIYAQDDEAYVGFPKVIVGQPYRGPIYDAQTIIIPSFTFIK